MIHLKFVRLGYAVGLHSPPPARQICCLSSEASSGNQRQQVRESFARLPSVSVEHRIESDQIEIAACVVQFKNVMGMSIRPAQPKANLRQLCAEGHISQKYQELSSPTEMMSTDTPPRSAPHRTFWRSHRPNVR